ncbi:MAG: efflux RND transporter periplasmic adaptor subunit [Leptolyngbyaceae cyanobacterium bins.59]|nr:efflux RND transporter periplasmic adaptor subunit [Leptolyngbyaceae cyanobacterium bins.59]
MQIPMIGNVKQPVPWLLGLLTVGVVGASATTFALSRRPPKQDVTSLMVPAQVKDLTVRIETSGTVTPFQTVNVSPKIAGRIASLYVEQGDRVQRGQVLARMESEELDAQKAQVEASIAQAQARLARLQNGTRSEEIAQAGSTVAQAESQVQQAQSRLLLASQRVQRNQSLYTEGAISRDRLDEVINEERNARANLEQAQARVQELRQRQTQLVNGARPEEILEAQAQIAEARGRLQQIVAQLENAIIRAPFAGIIAQKYATEGAFVSPAVSASSVSSATSTSIVALANGLEVLAEVPEVNIGQIKPGQLVEIRADAYPDKTFKGKVRLIAPAAVKEQNVTSFQIRVALTTGKNELRSGMNVDATFLGQQIPDTVVVPITAIVTQDGETGVLIPGEKNEPLFKPVLIGTTTGRETQVLEGLEPGQRVFTELPEGQRLDKIRRVK